MAAADLNLSRRQVLGAAFAAPLLPSAHPERASSLSRCGVEGPPPAATAAWDRTLAAFRRAEATVLALEGGPDEDAFGRAHDRFNLALRRLFDIPSPDVAALAVKLEAAVAAELADLTYAPPALAVLARDARRLASLRSS